MLLHRPINTSHRSFKPRSILTAVPPGISRFMYLHPRGNDIGGIAEERQPHVFNMQIIERLPYRSVELVTLANGISARSAAIVLVADRCVCDDRISHIREQSPDITHPPAELFSASRARDKITFSRVKATDECPDTGAYGARL